MSIEARMKGANNMSQKIVLPPQTGEPSDVERIKRESNYLRGTLAETLVDPISFRHSR